MPEYLYEKHFTLAEAEAVLPEVVARLEEMQALLVKAAAQVKRTEQIQLKSRQNGHSHAAPAEPDYLEQVQSLLVEIHGMGVQVKDPAVGLVDFPHLRDGEEVFLCFRLGEARIEFWHTLTGGFAARRPL